ncbi:creatininase family protein [Sediminicoccus rosea]|uniref:Creatininase family protein n=1 Tax=Sediminicoccus rosea TaxID=1225128 RepID=A0ABZ0PH84_9PROT|nr:creatininase family protein [Sediminicoccus rosea]WPB85080.1 creatininase family protein [Sediminicoccus rosea]
MRIAELSAPEVAARIAEGCAVLLPMGSTETHGPALPMGDYLFAEGIAMHIARSAGDVLVAPPLAFGGADFFRGVPGGVALSTPTLTALVTEILVALHEGGARRILIINGHGGNIPAIEDAQRALRHRHGAIIPVLHLWKSAGAWQTELGGSPDALGHGGDPVASVGMHLRPDLCQPALLRPRAAPEPFLGLPVSGFGTIRAPAGDAGVDFGVPIELPEIAPGGVQAKDPSGANPELGARIVARHVAAATALLAAMKAPA